MTKTNPDALDPIMTCFGGKGRTSDQIGEMIDKTEHTDYGEPFSCGASVYFKTKPRGKDFINDINPFVTRFFRQLKAGFKYDQCDMTPSRERWKQYKKDLVTEGIDIDPCKLLYLNKHSYGNKFSFDPDKGGYGNHDKKCNARDDPSRCFITRLTPESIKNYEKRMENTDVLNADYRDVVRQHDAPGMLLYMDPPYEDHAKDYNVDEGPVTPEEVAKTVRGLKNAKAIVSINDSPRVRKAFEGMNFIPLCFKYTTNNNEGAPVCELLITNYETKCEWNPDKKKVEC